MTSAARRRPRRRRPWRAVALVLGAALVFAVGVALGAALDDAPEPGTRTLVRTLEPLELPPERETVTVTVTGP